MKPDYDVVILGGGSAGIVSGVTAGGLGLRVLLNERNRMGGECLNTGCVPSKAFIHSARVAHVMRTAGECGLRSAPLNRRDADGVMEHVRSSIAAVSDADATEQLLRDHGVEIRIGTARFMAPDTLALEERVLRAGQFILATGSRPRRPRVPGLEEAGYLTNTELFSLEAIPESLAVIGGGPIGVEMAQAFARLGSRVTLVHRRGRILPRDDDEAAGRLQEILRQEGVDLRLERDLAAVERVENRRRLHLRGGPSEETVEAAEILVAVGRRPNVEGLNLEAAGVEYGERGVVVDKTLHTTGPRTWACGDILGSDPFSHMAEFEAKLVVQNLFLPLRQRISQRTRAWTTFTDPELASVGLTEEEALRAGIRFEVHRQPFSQNDRAIVDGEAQGMVKILATRWTGQILGAQILGPRAGELIQEFILAIGGGLTIRDVANAIHVYPTLAMACQHAAQRWYERRAGEAPVQLLLTGWRDIRSVPGRTWGAAAAGALVSGLAAWQLTRRTTVDR